MFTDSEFFFLPIEYVYLELEHHAKAGIFGNRHRLVFVRHCALNLCLFIGYIIKQLSTIDLLNMM